MPINYFIGWDQGDLEEALRAAQEELAVGRATVGANSADVGIRSEVEQSITARIELLLQALNKLDPVTYPIDQVNRISSFKAVLNSVPPGCNQ
jgi:hypothetical protein